MLLYIAKYVSKLEMGDRTALPPSDSYSLTKKLRNFAIFNYLIISTSNV